MTAPRAWALGLGAVALLARLPLLFDRYTAEGVPDAQGYLAIAADIVHGRGFPASTAGLIRTPGYPVFIALMDVLPGRREDAVIVAQHLIGAGLVAAIVLVVWRFFGRAPAVLAGALAAITPGVIAAEHDVLTDFLFGALVFAATALLAACASRPPASVRRLAAAGLLFGAATQVRPTGQVLLLAAPVVLALTTRRLRETVRASLVVTAAMAIVVVPWIVRNQVVHDAPVLSIIGQQSLFWRVFDQDHLPLASSGPDAKVAADVIARTPSGPGVITNTVLPVTAALSRRHSAYETANIEAGLALDAIRASPGRYAISSARNLKELTLMTGGSAAATSSQTLSSVRARARTERPGAFRLPIAAFASAAWRAAPSMLSLWLVLALVTPLALVLRVVRAPARAALLAFAWVWLLIEGASALTAIPTPRFAAQAMPLQLVAGSAGIAIVAEAAWSRVRRRRPRPAEDAPAA